MTDCVALSTLDVRETAGTFTVTKFVYQTLLENGWDPYFVFNAVPWDDCLTITDLVTGNRNVSYENRVFKEMNGVMIGRVLPEFSVFNYVLNDTQWQRALRPAVRNLVVGGTCLQGLPLARNDIPFGCWIGTTLSDQQLRTGRGIMSHVKCLRNLFSRPLLYRYETYVLERAKTVLVQSTHTKQQVLRRTTLSEGDITVIPFPIDTEEFAPVETGNRQEVLFVGRLNAERKNTSNLIRAFARVLEQVPQATLTLVGAEPTEELRSLVDDLGIESSVIFPGSVHSVVPYYQRSSVFAIPSDQEGLGIAGLEAQSCGTPVVSTDCGGPSEYVEDGTNGYLVPIDDPSTLANRITELLSNDSRRAMFARNSRQNVLENFSKEVIVPKLLKEIEALPEA